MQNEICKRKIRPLSDENIDEDTLNNYSGYRKWTSTLEPVYNDIALCDTSSITSDTLWYQFFTVNHYVILPCYNDIILCNTSPITSDILWYQFFTVNHYVILPGYNDTTLCNTSCITSDILWYQFFTPTHNLVLIS